MPDHGGKRGRIHPQRVSIGPKETLLRASATLCLQSEVKSTTLTCLPLLCSAASINYTGEEKFLGPALRAARYSAGKQHADGSWDYGELPTQRWIDNFHTGYNLGALQSISKYADTTEFASHIQSGFEFYRAHFFREDGAVRYFHDRTYPIDAHCVAQSIITLLAFKDKGLEGDNVALARSTFHWAMNHMWDDRGFFYYRVLRFCTIRTSYMRWCQAWMFLAISILLSESRETQYHPQPHDSGALAQA